VDQRFTIRDQLSTATVIN